MKHFVFYVWSVDLVGNCKQIQNYDAEFFFFFRERKSMSEWVRERERDKVSSNVRKFSHDCFLVIKID